MIDPVDAAGVKLGVISQRRFYELVLRVQQAILDGKIGAPVLDWRAEAYDRSDPWQGKRATGG